MLHNMYKSTASINAPDPFINDPEDNEFKFNFGELFVTTCVTLVRCISQLNDRLSAANNNKNKR